VSWPVVIGAETGARLAGTMETEIMASEIAKVQNQIVRTVMAARLFDAQT